MKIEDTIESEGYKCPYCGDMPTCDDWGFDYDGETIECDSCGKKYRATANHSVDFKAEPDCELNNEHHKLKFHSSGDFKLDYYFCEVCNKCVSVEKDKNDNK